MMVSMGLSFASALMATRVTMVVQLGLELKPAR